MKTVALLLIAITSLWANLENQKEYFQEHDFLWIKNFYSKEQVELLCNWADEMHEAALNESNLIVVKEAENTNQICRVEDLLGCYPETASEIFNPVMVFLYSLLDEPYVPYKDKLNFKWPGGGAFPPHQDFPAYEPFGPKQHITAMICIDAATLENGCLHVDGNWEGKNTLLPYVAGGKNHGSIEPEYAENINWIPLETSPGDLVIFTSFLPHYSEKNNSNDPRRAIFFTLNPLSEGNHRDHYYYMKRNDPENPLFHFGTPTKARTK